MTESADTDERRCGGCGTPVPAPEGRAGWRFTDAPWCPKCAWLA
jgi:hypothetical protein